MHDHDNDNDRTQSYEALTSGTLVHHYRIAERIGAGGMGEVYLAQDTKLSRKVAIKFLPVALTTDSNIRARFVREAQTVAGLNHPNIVSVYEVGEFKGRPFYVMELVEGNSLRTYTTKKSLPVDVLVEYSIQICQGLAEAHRAGIVHRDVKPDNIVVDTKGRIRLLDFGVAAVEGADKLTKSGSTIGTVSYMSPEQISGRDVDHRSDLFSFGIVLYELIAGVSPFRRDNDGATLKAIIEDIPEPLARFRSALPDKLQQVVSELLEKDRELRFQSAEGVIAALKRLTYDSQPSGFKSVPTKSRKIGLYVGTAAAALLIVAALMYAFVGTKNAEPIAVDREPLIAVLPFENLGPPEDEYFADGMTEEITSRLAGIEGIGVISRTSAVRLAESDRGLKQIGAELGIGYVLEGTVRWDKTGESTRVRITPQLIRISDDRHLWADNYERSLMDVFSVQADIAEHIVEQLGLALTASDRQRLSGRPTGNAGAYQLYLKALSNMRREVDYESRRIAQALLDTAVLLDSTFALAHALRSEAYAAGSGLTPESDNGKEARASALRSLEIQPNLPQGYLALGNYYSFVDPDYDLALDYLSKAKSEIHDDPELHDKMASLQSYLGQYKDALANRQKAAELDPLNPRRHNSLAGSLTRLRRFQEAEQSINRAIALDPNTERYYGHKISIRASLYGDIDSIRSVVTEALKYCDTTEIIVRHSMITRRMPQLATDSIVADFISQNHSDTAEAGIFAEWWKQRSISLGHMDIVRDYPEEAIILARWAEPGKDYKHWAGILYSFAGRCEKAISLGLQEKEIAANPECAP